MQNLMALLSAGRSSDAEKKARKLVKKFPNAIVIHNVLGAALAGQGKFDGAASCHRRVLKIMPDYAEAHYNLGVALGELGKSEEARASFEAAIKIKPSLTEAHNNLGIVLHKLSRPEEAVACYRQALTHRPDFAEAHSNLGKALLALERPEEAVASCQEALRITPRLTETHKILGKAFQKLGRLDEALKAFDEELKLQPDNLYAGINRAAVLKDLGQPDEALDAYDTVLKQDATFATAHAERGLLLAKTGRIDDALDAFEKALAHQGTHSIRTLYALSQLPASLVNVDILAMIDEAEPEENASKEEFESWRAATRAAELHKAGQYAEAWENLITANRHGFRQEQDEYVRTRLQREAILAQLRNAPAVKIPDDVDGHPLSLNILGPSRSGKTTLENLAASLGGTTRGFEHKIVRNASDQAFESFGLPRTTPAIETSPAADAKFCEIYFKELEKRAGGAQIFTNTFPGNIEKVYRMAAVLPNSRFIFLQRDVSDICLRIYMKIYGLGYSYAYDIDNIIEYVTWYNEMIGVLTERFPQISKVIRYEDLIAEPAATLQSVAELCGTVVPKDVDLPLLGDDRGCAEPYKAFIHAEP